jgi:ribosome-associated protein
MEKLTFELDKEFIELNKLLKFMGVTETGGSAKMLVAAGEVRVDGGVELRKACKIRAGQTVETGDVQIQVLAAKA